MVSVTAPEIRTGLDALFLPDSVAVIGATERASTVGRTVLENLLHPSFRGKVFAVNSRHSEICGRKAYPSIGDIPEKVDLAVVATPAPTVPGIIGQCVDAGVKSARSASGLSQTRRRARRRSCTNASDSCCGSPVS